MNVTKKVSAATVVSFKNRFHREAKYKNMRFGQAFLNEFYPNESHPELFYEGEERRAEIIIYAFFVDFTIQSEVK